MKVYCVIGSRDYHGYHGSHGSSEPYGIYADEMRANAVCAVLNAHSKYSINYEVFEYEVQE